MEHIYKEGDKVRIIGNGEVADDSDCHHYYDMGDVVRVEGYSAQGNLCCRREDGFSQLVNPAHVELVEASSGVERFHITIRDNASGEVLVDLDTCAIIGALDHGPGTRVFCKTKCGSVELAATAAGALQAAGVAMADMPAGLARKVRKIGRKKI